MGLTCLVPKNNATYLQTIHWLTYLSMSKILSKQIYTIQILAQLLIQLHLYLSAIATCRYLGTFRPFIYSKWATPKMVTITSVFIVAYSFIIPTWLTLGHHRQNPVEICALFTLCIPWATMVMSGHTYVLMAAIAFVYQRILREALRVKRQINAAMPRSFQGNGDSGNRSQIQSDATRLEENINVLKNFAIIVGTSFMVWMPHAILSDYLSHKPPRVLWEPRVQKVLITKAIALALVSVLNPIIYAIRLKWFRVMLRYIKGSISYRECEQSMSNIWRGSLKPMSTKLLDLDKKRKWWQKQVQ